MQNNEDIALDFLKLMILIYCYHTDHYLSAIYRHQILFLSLPTLLQFVRLFCNSTNLSATDTRINHLVNICFIPLPVSSQKLNEIKMIFLKRRQ